MEDQMKRLEKRLHEVKIEEKKRVTVTAVEDVDSFNENEVIFLSLMGMITVIGEDLHIARLDLDAGQLVIDGTIQAVDYSDHAEQRAEKSGLFGKLFR